MHCCGKSELHTDQNSLQVDRVLNLVQSNTRPECYRYRSLFSQNSEWSQLLDMAENPHFLRKCLWINVKCDWSIICKYSNAILITVARYTSVTCSLFCILCITLYILGIELKQTSIFVLTRAFCIPKIHARKFDFQETDLLLLLKRINHRGVKVSLPLSRLVNGGFKSCFRHGLT